MLPWGPEEHGESISVRGGESAGWMDFPSVPVSLACLPSVLTCSGSRLLFPDRPCSLRKEAGEAPARPPPLDCSSHPRPQPPCWTERLSLSLPHVGCRVAPCTPGPKPCRAICRVCCAQRWAGPGQGQSCLPARTAARESWFLYCPLSPVPTG